MAVTNHFTGDRDDRFEVNDMTFGHCVSTIAKTLAEAIKDAGYT